MNRNWKYLLITIISLSAISDVGAQEKLSLQQLVEEVLASNLDVRISRLQAEGINNLATAGQADMLPAFGLNGNANYGNNNTSLEFAGDLPPVQVDGAENTSFGASIGLNYTIFNGFGRIASLDNLRTNASLSETQARLLSENLVVSTVNNYLDLLLAGESVDLAKRSLQISADRLKRAQLGYENGSRTKLEELSAQVDFNNDSLTLLSAMQQKELLSMELNFLLKRPLKQALALNNELPVPTNINFSQAQSRAQSNSSSLLLGMLASELAESDSKLARAGRYPILSGSASYGHNKSENGAGIILSQSSTGLSAGLTLSYSLFNGGKVNAALENASLNAQAASLEIEKARLEIEKAILNLELDYQLALKRIESQNINLQLSELAMARAVKSYELGQLTFPEFRQFQLNLVRSKFDLIQSRYALIRYSYQLRYLSGDLLD